MSQPYKSLVARLMEKGVVIPDPETVSISPEVDIERISGKGVVLHSGSRLRGADTFIADGAVLGEEAPTVIENCQIGPGARLKGGFFKSAVFLRNASMGSGAHVREGTILEEEASGAHTVGFKQTILFPYVTVGSLINFCDCLMAGGTGKKNHSEVGSSYIHFNFTPNQDKATASMIGDVARGVMLNQRPIFLGGQGGLVGPSRLEYGTVIAAGSIYRKDELRPGRLVSAGDGRSINIPNTEGIYKSIKRIVQNNIIYIANLTALEQWYKNVRSQFVSEEFAEPLFAGLMEKADMAIAERVKRLGLFAAKLPESAENYRRASSAKVPKRLMDQKMEFSGKWGEISRMMISRGGDVGDLATRDAFLGELQKEMGEKGRAYLEVIQSLNEDGATLGTRWLKSVVDSLCRRCFDMLPSFSFDVEKILGIENKT